MLDDDRALAGSLVRAAGQLAARMRADGVRVERKTSVSDVVSAADHAAEELIVARLRAERPDDAIVGEEGTDVPGAGRTWFLDPVDGTYNFVSGLATWCSAVALADAGPAPLVGAVYHPAADELWLGGTGAATTCNGVEVPRLTERSLADSSLALYLHPPRLADAELREPLLRAYTAAATVRMLGSGSVELAAVAGGRLGAWLQLDAPPWDWLPGAALVESAGGTTRAIDAHGHRWLLAGCARVVDELLALVLDE